MNRSLSVRALACLLAVAALGVTVSGEPLAQSTEASPRFADRVRADFVAGTRGDQAAMGRAMKICEEALAENPKNAAAMVWHGAGLLALGGRDLMAGNFQQGGMLWKQGLDEMDAAVALAPDDLGVRLTRGSTLLEASRHYPSPDVARSLLEKGVGDFERVLALQTPSFDTLSTSARGELLFALGDGWHRLGDAEKARSYFRRVVDECKGSGREAQAAKFLGDSK